MNDFKDVSEALGVDIDYYKDHSTHDTIFRLSTYTASEEMVMHESKREIILKLSQWIGGIIEKSHYHKSIVGNLNGKILDLKNQLKQAQDKNLLLKDYETFYNMYHGNKK